MLTVFNIASQPTKHITVQLPAKAYTKTEVRNQNVPDISFSATLQTILDHYCYLNSISTTATSILSVQSENVLTTH